MPKRVLEIDGRRIGEGEPPYVIAEVSANHNHSLERACEIVEMAARAGASAVKLQTYTPETITLKSDLPQFLINGGLWDGRTLYDLYAEAHMPWEWHAPLFKLAKTCGVSIFSTPFDETALELLEKLECPAYKIASFECIDLPLIKAVASTGKPMIISTGMADEVEIQDAVETARTSGCSQLALLQCVSGYPAPAGDYNLRTIPDMARRFDVVSGISDHTLSNATSLAAVALGASIIEKHVTMDRSGGGPDDSFSLEPSELTSLCLDARVAWESIGAVDYGKKSSEIGNIKFRRSLYFVRNMREGECVTERDIRSVRPGYGLPPKYLEDVLGRTLGKSVSRAQPVSMDCFKQVDGEEPERDA